MTEHAALPSARYDLDRPRISALGALDESARREYWAALALRCTEGLGSRSICMLLKFFGSAWEAVQNLPSWEEAGIDKSKARAFSTEQWRKAAKPEWDAAKKLQGHILLWTDTRYPRYLRELDDAPALLYAVGDLSLLSSPCVAVVGSRKCSQAALDFTTIVAEELSAAGITVVSGMAFGIDARAHRSALKGPGRTIAVLATGVDVPYPAHHTELYRKIAAQGLILGELPLGTKPSPWAFPVRNRIVSGLSLGVLMVEAESEKSGSLITARLAAEQGRSVYVPAPDAIRAAYKEGTKSLLNSGAFPIWRASDLMADLFPHLKRMAAPVCPPAVPAPRKKEQEEKADVKVAPAPTVSSNSSQELPKKSAPAPSPASRPAMPALSADEEALLSLLGSGPLSPDDLLLAAQEHDAAWSAPRLMAALMMLEVKGQVRRLSDSRYEVCA